MKKLALGSVLTIVAFLLIAMTAVADVVIYPTPQGETLSTDYEVLADGKKVDVYRARTLDVFLSGTQSDHGGPYSFASFDTSGPVTVRIVAKQSLRNVVVRPASSAVHVARVDEHTLTLAIDGPRKLSIEPDGKRGPLLLFANPTERDAPKPGPNVRYFGPGVHRAGKIDVASGQTVYLAGGAVVQGAIQAVGSNIRICGRGVLDGSIYSWRHGPCNSIDIRGNDVLVEGITIRGSPQWTIVPTHSRNVVVRNVKICNARVPNDDGIDPCNSQDVLITDCFIRSDDDCVALKGMETLPSTNSNIERVRVENCILWSDRARVFLLGHESRASTMSQITLRNLDVFHFTCSFILMEPGEEMCLEDVTVENVRIRGERQPELIRLCPTINEYMVKKSPGLIRNVVFRNITLEGAPGNYAIQLLGADAAHDVRGVLFEKVSLRGVPVDAKNPSVTVGKHVEGVRFVTK
ncbi:MAG: glycosyl hydrolase family 28 protein [Thermoguttaceae bacterium]